MSSTKPNFMFGKQPFHLSTTLQQQQQQQQHRLGAVPGTLHKTRTGWRGIERRPLLFYQEKPVQHHKSTTTATNILHVLPFRMLLHHEIWIKTNGGPSGAKRRTMHDGSSRIFCLHHLLRSARSGQSQSRRSYVDSAVLHNSIHCRTRTADSILQVIRLFLGVGV